MSLNKVAKECQCASYNQSYGEPVRSAFHGLACRSFGESRFFVLESKDESNTAFGFGGFAGGNNNSGFKSGSAEIGALDSSRVHSAWSWSCPSGDLFAAGNDSERVLGNEVFSFEPSDNNGVERVMDLNVVICVDDLWANYENPEQGCNCSSVHDANQSIEGFVYSQVANGNKDSDCKNSPEVNPVSSCSVEVVAHDPNSTAPKNSFYSDLLVEKGK